jgi:general secretion pathway protein G
MPKEGLVAFDVIIPNGQSVQLEVESNRTAEEIAKVIAIKAGIAIPSGHLPELYVLPSGEPLTGSARDLAQLFEAGNKIGLRIVPFSSREHKDVSVKTHPKPTRIPREDYVPRPEADGKTACAGALGDSKQSGRKMLTLQSLSPSQPLSTCGIAIFFSIVFVIAHLVGIVVCTLANRHPSDGLSYTIAGLASAIMLVLGFYGFLGALRLGYTTVLMAWGISWSLLHLLISGATLQHSSMRTFLYHHQGFQSLLLVYTGIVLGLLFKHMFKEFLWKHVVLVVLGWTISAVVWGVSWHLGMSQHFWDGFTYLDFSAARLFALSVCVASGGFASGIALRLALSDESVSHRHNIPLRLLSKASLCLAALVLVATGGFLLIVMRYRQADNMRDTAKSQMLQLMNILSEYKIEFGAYPDSLEALVKHPGGLDRRKGYFPNQATVPRDPWGNNFIYQNTRDGGLFLISMGADGTEGGTGYDADIVWGVPPSR